MLLFSRPTACLPAYLSLSLLPSSCPVSSACFPPPHSPTPLHFSGNPRLLWLPSFRVLIQHSFWSCPHLCVVHGACTLIQSGKPMEEKYIMFRQPMTIVGSNQSPITMVLVFKSRSARHPHENCGKTRRCPVIQANPKGQMLPDM